MIRSILSRVMWVGRATVFTVGLAVTLALMLGVVTVALAAVPGDPFRLGRSNTINAISTLVGSTSTPILRIDNNGNGAALDLQVGPGKAPMKVNSGTKVANLNSDTVDGYDSFDFYQFGEKVQDSAHADYADSAGEAQNAQVAEDADSVDGHSAENFYYYNEKVDDSDKLDGSDSSDYARSSALSSPGTLNASSNPVDWTKLKGVPAGIADGEDATTPDYVFATVLGNGSLWYPDSSSHAVSSSRVSAGEYKVAFDQDISNGCVHIAQSAGDTFASTSTTEGLVMAGRRRRSRSPCSITKVGSWMARSQ